MYSFKEAQANMETKFVDNPCRAIAVGKNSAGNIILLSSIMGRSENSQNRTYKVENNVLSAIPLDWSKVKNPELVTYNAMLETNGAHIVGNGRQIDQVYDAFQENVSYRKFQEVMKRWNCEPDAPIFTPRISAFAEEGANQSFFNILLADEIAKKRWLKLAESEGGKPRTDPYDPSDPELEKVTGYERKKFPTIVQDATINLREGFGHCVTTYMPGSKNLPSFQGSPFLIPMQGELEDIMQTFWETLEPEWRVAVGGKEIARKWSRYAEPINKHNL